MQAKIGLIDLLRKCFSQDKISMNYHGVFDDVFTEQLISLVESDFEKKAKKKNGIVDFREFSKYCQA